MKKFDFENQKYTPISLLKRQNNPTHTQLQFYYRQLFTQGLSYQGPLPLQCTPCKVCKVVRPHKGQSNSLEERGRSNSPKGRGQSNFSSRELHSISNRNEEASVFLNVSFDKGRLKSFVLWFLKNYGQKRTIELLEHLKDVGFGYATKAGISLGIDDLKIPPQKIDLLQKAQTKILEGQIQYKRGEITGVERFQGLIDTWHQTSESLKQEVVRHFEATDLLNPVYMMAFSGARGNISQVRQLVGMRGLMADPQGQIIDFPIRSNFREGLTLTEYIISTYGARKGIVDTALRTANAGYLTRRLVDVAQHVIVAELDCGTKKGVFIFDMKEGNKTIYSFQNRLIGRVLAKDISYQNEQIAIRNQEISADLAFSISKIAKKALIRSPLTCQTKKLVCQLCYGWSLSNSSLVSIGEAVGIIAAQSIGEPGTQLTMRTFHTGGVFSGGLSDQIIAQYNGIVEYSESIPGLCIRTPQGQIAFLTKAQGTLILKRDNDFLAQTSGQTVPAALSPNQQIFQIPPYTLLFARNKQTVVKKQIIGQLSSLSHLKTQRGDAEQTIYSEFEGQIYNSHIDIIGKINESNDITFEAWGWGYLWILAGKIYQCPIQSFMFAHPADFVNQNSILNRINWMIPQKCSIQTEFVSENKTLLQNSNARESFFTKNLFNFSHYQTNSSLLKEKNTLVPRLSKNVNSLCLTSKLMNSAADKKEGATACSKSEPELNVDDQKVNFVQSNICSTRFIRVKFNPEQLSSVHFKLCSTENILVSNGLIYSNYPFQKLVKKMIFKSFNQRTLEWTGVSRKNSSFRKDMKQKKQLFLLSQMYHFNKWTMISLIHQVVRKKIIKNQIRLLFKANFETKEDQKEKWTVPQSDKFPFSVTSYYLSRKSGATYSSSKETKQNLKTSSLKVAKIWTLKNLQKKSTKKTIYSSKTKYLTLNAKKDNKINIWIKNGKQSNNVRKKLLNIEQFNINASNFSHILYQNKLQKFQKISYKNEQKYPRFPNLILKKPVLFLNLKNLQYNKLGYHFSIYSKTGEATRSKSKDQFFCLNPLNQKVMSETVSLKNTYQWSPASTFFLKWFSMDFQTQSNGIFRFARIYSNSKKSFLTQIQKNDPNLSVFKFFLKEKNPDFICDYQTAVKYYLTTKKIPHLKNKNKWSFDILKNYEILPLINIRREFKKNWKQGKMHVENSYQSQKHYFDGFKQPQPSVPSNQKYSFYLVNFRLSHYEQHFSFCKKQSFLNKNQFDYFSKQDIHTVKTPNLPSSFQAKIKVLCSSSKLLRPRSSSELLHPLFIKFQAQLKVPFKFQNVHSKKLRWQNVYSWRKLEDNRSKKRIGPARFKMLNKKLRTTFGSRSSLSKFGTTNDMAHSNSTTKLSLHSNEVFWIPQEDYQIHTWQLNDNLNKLNHLNKSLFIHPCSSAFQGNSLNNRTLPLFYSKNRQGNKKLFYSNLDGIVQIYLTKSQKMNLDSRSNFILDFKNHIFENRLNLTKDAYKTSLAQEAPKTCRDFQIKFYHFLKLKWRNQFLYKNGLAKSNSLLRKNSTSYVDPALHEKCTTLPQSGSDSALALRASCFTLVKAHTIGFQNKAVEMPFIAQFAKQSQFFSCLLMKRSLKGLNVLSLKAKEQNRQAKSTPFVNFVTKNNALVFENQTVNLRVQQGWVYYTNNPIGLPKLHQTFVNPGHIILDDIYFDKHPVYLTCMVTKPISLDFLNQNNFTVNNLKTNQFSFKISEKITNFKTRFNLSNFQKPLQSSNEVLEDHSNLTCLFIRPSHYKLLPSLHSFKKNLLKKNKKCEKPNFSRLMLNKFYSSSLNKQKSDKKLVSNFPNVDIKVSSSFRFSKMKKFYKSPKFRKPNHVSFFYSSYPLNFLPLNLAFSIPSAFSYYFKEPSIQFNSSHNFSLNTLHLSNCFSLFDYIKFQSDLLHSFISKYHFLKVQTFSDPAQIGSQFDFSQSQNSLNLSGDSKTKYFSLFHQSVFISSIGLLCSLPCFDFSLSNKMSYLTNQKLFGTDFTNQWFNAKKPFLERNKYQKIDAIHSDHFLKERVLQTVPELYYNSFSSFPISKNEFSLSQLDGISSNQPFANTSFLSPVEGEMLNNISNTWAFQSDQDRYLFLTPADLLSFSLVNHKDSDFTEGREGVKGSVGNVVTNPPSLPFKPHVGIEKNLQFGKMSKYPKYVNLVNNLYFLHQHFSKLEQCLKHKFLSKNINPTTTLVQYNQKILKIKGLRIGNVTPYRPLRLGSFLVYGDVITLETGADQAGQIIHMNSTKITLRYAQPISASPKGILHAYNGDFVPKNTAVITLPFQTLKTGDIVQGIPKVEQYFEARTTKRGRLFRDSLPNLLQGIFERYRSFLPLEIAVQQSFLKIQQIIVDGVQRVYRSQGVSIADKHLEVIVRQMTSKVLVVNGGQTGFFAGELVDLELIERVNPFLLNKIKYEPVILGITRASLEVDSFLSAASFQQTTKMLSRAAIYKKKDFLKGLKENIIVGNLIPGGTGYLVYLQDIGIQAKTD